MLHFIWVPDQSLFTKIRLIIIEFMLKVKLGSDTKLSFVA